MRIELDLPLDTEAVNHALLQRANSQTIKPELTTPEYIKKPLAYKRFQNGKIKEQFRTKLITKLHSSWLKQCSANADQLRDYFLEMASQVSDTGALIFGDLIHRRNFATLVQEYDKLLVQHGNQSWIHSYVNLGNHPNYLADNRFNNAFLHPLLIALISYQIGGPIRIVDARGKNAEPISVKAQDNMLHIDNTPFNDEYKIIVTWEKGKASGPKGQNFVIIPGTHKGARNCFIDKNGLAWSTENGSIFVTPDSVQKVFDLQRNTSSKEKPVVVEVHDDFKPLTTLFAAGSLVHHRYRTEEGVSRSCMILAFHRAGDNPGQFMAPEHIKSFSKDGVNSFLFGLHGENTEEAFIVALAAKASLLANKMDDIQNKFDGIEVIAQSNRQLTTKEFEKWKQVVTSAPTVEDLKIKDLNFPLGGAVDEKELFSFLGNRMMMFDKHGPLDLILYKDAHEEIRKWGRNRIREMKQEQINSRLERWLPYIVQPKTDQLLDPFKLQSIASKLTDDIDNLPETNKNNAKLDSVETISPQDAYRSIRQLIEDLGEAIVRCDTRQTFLSASLFLFWSVDELLSLERNTNQNLMLIGSLLLSNYIATSVLIEKQIKHELSHKATANTETYNVREPLTRTMSFFGKVENDSIIENRKIGIMTLDRSPSFTLA